MISIKAYISMWKNSFILCALNDKDVLLAKLIINND